jgi:hypothetical protein
MEHTLTTVHVSWNVLLDHPVLPFRQSDLLMPVLPVGFILDVCGSTSNQLPSSTIIFLPFF